MRTFDGFFEILGELDWLAIIVAALVAYVVLGFLVFGPVFGKKFAAATGGSSEFKFDPKVDIPGLIMAFIFQIGVAYLGAYDDFEHALVTALVAGILLIGPVLYAPVLWMKGNRTAFLYQLTYAFLSIAVGTYVQGLFL